MRKAWWAAGAAAVVLGGVVAAVVLTREPDPKTWAYPALSPAPQSQDTAHTKRLPGSAVAYSEAGLRDQFHMVDWRPEAHTAAPSIVREGRKPQARACGFCHLPEGTGRPENASLAGLPADYIVRQLADMKAGSRRGAVPEWGPANLMARVAAAVSPEEAEAAAAYFSTRPFHPHTRVIEATTIPRPTPAGGIFRFAKDGATEQLGVRIVEGPEDFDRFELRDDQEQYLAYVPIGSVERGARLAAAEGPQACASCHGAGLKGQAGPPLAGRSPTGLFRQLYAFKTGARNGSGGAPMHVVAARLSVRDMIDLAAYAGSLR